MIAPPLRRSFLAKLDALEQLDSVPREAVLDLLVDLFFAQGESMAPAKRELCLDLIDCMLATAAPETRCDVLERLARFPETPRSRLFAWASGPIESAAPVLRYGCNLMSADLVAILGGVGAEHLRTVACRDNLTEDVAEMIVLRGDREAIAQLLANRSARLSPASLAAVAGLAWCDPSLRDALVQRADLPATIVDKLWSSLHIGFKARLIAAGWRYSMSEIEEVTRETSAALATASRAGALPQSVETYVAMLADGHVGINDALAEILEAGRLIEAAQLIARSLKLTEGIALNLLYGVYDQGAAVLARHAALSEAIVLQIAASRARLPWVRASDTQRTLATAAGIGVQEAVEILAALQTLWEAGVANTGERRRFRSVP